MHQEARNFFNRGCFLRPAVRNPGGRYDGLPPWFEFLGEPLRGQTHHDRGPQGSGFEIPNLAQKGTAGREFVCANRSTEIVVTICSY